MPKKKKVDHRASAEHKPKDTSASTASSSRPIVSSDHVNADARTQRAMRRAAAKSKTTQPQPKTVSLLELPLELLYMIFDYVASRNHLKHRRYVIRIKRGGGMVISQHALLMVCSFLRSGLTPYFYSTCSFHVKVHMRSMVRDTGDALTLEQIENKIPLPYRLSSVKLTFKIHELSKQGFNFSAIQQIAAMLFEEYRTQKLKFGDGPELLQLNWKIVCTDELLTCSCVRTVIDTYLSWLLHELHKKATETAVHTAKSSQSFSSKLQKWLEKECDDKDRTYWIRDTLRDCLTVTDSYERLGVLDSYWEACDCPFDSDDFDDDDEY